MIVGKAWVWKREAKQTEKKKRQGGVKGKKKNLEETKTTQKAEENSKKKNTLSSEKYGKKMNKNKVLWSRNNQNIAAETNKIKGRLEDEVEAISQKIKFGD